MEGIIIDYHILFITIAIALWILETFILFFSELTIEKLIGNIIITGFNMNMCMIVSFSFLGINIPGFDSSGNLVNNPTADMYMFFSVFLGLYLVNIGYLIYTNFMLHKLIVLKRNPIISK